MSGIATAIVGSAVVGGVVASKASSKANKTAQNINNQSLESQNQVYQQARADFQPYQQIGYDALPELRRMLGISSTTQNKGTPEQQNRTSAIQGMFGDKFDASNKRIGFTPPASTGTSGTSGSNPLSPLAQWQLQEFNKNQNRQDAARGLSGSGGASARLGEGASAIAANDYQAQYQRIIDAVKIGQGAAGSAGNASSQYSSQIGQNAGTNIGLAIDSGNTQANLWQGLGTLPMDYMSLQSRMNTGGTTGPSVATPSYSSSLMPAATSTKYGNLAL